MSKVWFVHEPRPGSRYDTSQLASLGECDYIIPRAITPSVEIHDAVRIARLRVREMKDDDYLVVYPSSDTFAATAVGLALATDGPDRVRWLRWDREVDPLTGRRIPDRGYYTPVRLNIDQVLPND